jgi:hypothetical protein
MTFIVIIFCVFIIVATFSDNGSKRDPNRHFIFLLERIKNDTPPELVNARRRIIKTYLKNKKITEGQAAILNAELDKLYK